MRQTYSSIFHIKRYTYDHFCLTRSELVKVGTALTGSKGLDRDLLREGSPLASRFIGQGDIRDYMYLGYDTTKYTEGAGRGSSAW